MDGYIKKENLFKAVTELEERAIQEYLEQPEIIAPSITKVIDEWSKVLSLIANFETVDVIPINKVNF